MNQGKESAINQIMQDITVVKKAKILPCSKIDKEDEFKKGASEMERNKIAVALGYEPSEEAPKIIASGQGYLAEKIIDKAKEEQVPLHKDTKLAKTLSKLEIGDMIPPELYEVVAEVLVFVDRIDAVRERIQ